ncbi:choice-of-anchor D domain-containing protein [Flavobacterium sp. MK4S-17]|uniref:choice-of-anchor D domain-containing protein n=1 Tax=Flavobacterium sp. MK4S-17 TaxID=2543737 RepID=UPI00135703F1|nr:choice-of-anchor D domain-containing protein [Flavobacterium sp. MK4S-17]
MFKKRFLLALALACITGLSFASFSARYHNAATVSAAFECTGGGNETFANLGANASNYATRSWTGDNGVAWTATDARTDQTLNGKAVAIRSGNIQNTSVITGGVGTLSFQYKRVFSGNSTLKVYVNDVQYGGDIAVSSETAATFSYAVNVAGNTTIKIVNSGNRTIIDDITWNCYPSVNGPELQLADVANNNFDCDSLEVNFGSPAVNTYQDAIFYIKNNGNQNLQVSQLNLSNTDNFSIISPAIPFSVAPSASSIVLVRFQSTTAGAKTGTLTIVNNDTDEASCVVNLAGIAVGPCAAPVADGSVITIDNVTATSADFSIENLDADGYLVVATTAAPLTSAPADGVTYAVNDALGGGTVVYNGTDSEFTVNGLSEDTIYSIFIYPYNNVSCTGGPVYIEEGFEDEISTPVAPCIGGSETFTNLGSSQSNYAVRSWVGDNGVAWTATDARTDQELNGEAIAIRTGSLSNDAPVSGGMGTLSFNYRRVFSGNSTLKVFVNNIQVGDDITVSSETPMLFTQSVDIEGDVTVEIENSGNRVIIDDLSWDCYQIPNEQELQLVDINGAKQACGNFLLDFGNVEAGVSNDAIFTIRNQGTVDLQVSALSLANNTNFEIVSPAAPFTVTALNSIDVTVRFNSAAAGSDTDILTITSNDADEATCVVNLAANALTACVAPVGGTVTIANVTDATADVSAGITADGYIAVIVEAGTGSIANPVNGTEYNVNDTLGDGTVVYAGTDANFTISGLNPETVYAINVYAYNNTDCVNGPAYTDAYEDEFETAVAPCVGGTETFANLGANASNYAVRTWTGENGIIWTANDARTDQTLNGKAIAVRSGSLTNVTAITGGIGTLSFQYKRVFTGNSTIKVYVNDVQVGTDITVSSDTPMTFSELVNIPDDAIIEIENSGNRVVIDDVSWDCYSEVSARPAAQSKEIKTAGTVSNSNSEVMVYPNPNNGSFEINLGNAAQNAEVVIYDSLGKQVLSKKINGTEAINLNNAQKGIYFAVIKSGNTVTNKKIVVN